MKILVTGCAGFIGFHFCQKMFIKKKNLSIVGIDNLNNYYSANYKKKRLNILKKYKNFNFNKVDINRFSSLEKIFKKHKFDLVVNFAAQAGVRYSIENPREYIKSNIVGFFNLAEMSKIYKVSKIIYASSSSVYGEKKKFPLTEKTEVDLKNIYSLTKKNNEEIAEIYSNYYNLKFIGLRFFTIYGEWGRPDMLILKYILAVVNKKTFYLNNYGDHFRDFTYIDDVIENIILLINKNNKKRHEIYNVCSNNPVSLKFVLSKINEAFGKPKIIKRSKQQADVYKTHGSNLKLINATKFKNYTKISTGLNNLINWAKSNIHLIR